MNTSAGPALKRQLGVQREIDTFIAISKDFGEPTSSDPDDSYVVAVLRPHKGEPNGRRVGTTYEATTKAQPPVPSKLVAVGHYWMRDVSVVPSESDMIGAMYPPAELPEAYYGHRVFQGLHFWFSKRVFGGGVNHLAQPEPSIRLVAETGGASEKSPVAIDATPDGFFKIEDEGVHALACTGSLLKTPVATDWWVMKEDKPIDWDLVDELLADVRYMLVV